MSLLTQKRLRTLSAARTKSPQRVLEEESKTTQNKFDVFLSHSIRDPELVLGAKEYLEKLDLTVYVDWITDPDLDRSKVSKKVAEMLRVRMKQCEILVYLHTLNSPVSKWMPWELGYFDGRKPGRVAIFPVAEAPRNEFVGQEYLGLYPYIDEAATQDSATPVAWMNQSASDYVRFDKWVGQWVKKQIPV